MWLSTGCVLRVSTSVLFIGAVPIHGLEFFIQLVLGGILFVGW